MSTGLRDPTRSTFSSQRGTTAKAFGYPAILSILAVHIALGVGGAINPNVATAHAGLTVAVSLIVMFGTRRPELVVAVAAYGGICDVYWRMTESRAPWELSKYLLALGAVALLVRFVRRWPRGAVPIVFLLVLVPGVLVTLATEGLANGREAISSTEMGLISFGLGALAFRHLVATRTDAWNLGWVLLGPLVAVLSVATHALLTTPDLDFSDESNAAAVGGFGPNQVSSALGLTMLICALLAFLPQVRKLWPVLAALGLWSLWGAFLTFSRGGIYSLVLAGAGMLLVGIGTRGTRARSAVTLVLATAALFIVFASANDFTGNWLDTRYQNAEATGRTNIAALDVEVFASHPLAGVGSGRAREFRGEGQGSQSAAHTEFTRVLAEHGLLGMVALGLLGTMLVQAYRMSLSQWNRLMVVGLSLWTLTTMLHAATRIGAVSVMLALTQLRVEATSRQDND
jgi:hypothetical protein